MVKLYLNAYFVVDFPFLHTLASLKIVIVDVPFLRLLSLPPVFLDTKNVMGVRKPLFVVLQCMWLYVSYLTEYFSLFFRSHLGKPGHFLLLSLLCDYILMIFNDVLMHLHNARKVLITVGTLARASIALLVLLLHVGSQVRGLCKSVRLHVLINIIGWART